MREATLVFVPGLRDHVPDHWQTLLQARIPGSVCVPRLGKENLALDAWVEALEATVAAVRGSVVLVAHSAGVMMLVQWALEHSTRSVAGALLATPPDFESGLPAGYPSRESLAENGWMPIPRELLPFRSIVVGSRNDPLATLDRAAAFARDWGSELVDAGAVGHLNPASGFGEWPQAIELLAALGVEIASHPVTD